MINKVNKLKILIYIIILFLGSILIYFGTNITFLKNNKILNYRQEPNISYKVYLKENDEYQMPYLEENQTYPSRLVSDIIISFDYNLLTNKKIDINYNYDIQKELFIYDIKDLKLENNLVEEIESITEESNVKESNVSGYKIKKTVPINFIEYQHIIKDYETLHNIKTNSFLKVTFNTNLTGNVEDNKFTTKDKFYLNIPLNENSFTITEQLTDNEQSITALSKEATTNDLSIILGFIFIVGSSILTILEISKIPRHRNLKIIFNQEVDHLLVKYKNKMIKTRKIPSMRKRKNIEVVNLSDLLKLQKEFKTTILVNEKTKLEEVWFVLLCKDEAWIYKKRIEIK